ncbi:restriction endonuclease subunit S [Flavobacterium psychrophilum]
MELRPGYKKTDVGVIPQDWEIATFGDIVDYTKGFPFKSKDYQKDGIRIIRVSDTTFDDIKKNNGIYVDERISFEFKKWELLENDLIFTTVGSKPPMYDSMVGKVIMVSKEFEGSFLNQNAVLIRSKKKTKEKQVLLLSHFRMRRYLQHIELIYRGNANQASITLKELFGFQIPLPSTETEQNAIATALSDTDNLIKGLEKLISKKRNIKQGAMQKLLKPKDGWELKKLGSIGKSYGGLSGKSKLDFADGKFPYIPFMNIMSNPIIKTNYVDYVNIEVNEYQNKALKGDLFFNGSSETPEEVGMCSILLEDIPNLYLNSFCFGFRLNKDSKENGLYLSYFFRSSEGRKLFYSMAQGATRYNLSKGNFNKLEISLPKPEDQIVIANILTDMNNEITALETKLEKYKKVKLGMSQNLLTGKIRLI